MDLTVTFLGTGGSAPSARRSTASVMIARGGVRMLFDCGEGTQRQMQRSLGLVQVDEIYLTHFHSDHVLGIPGLLKTYDLTDREAPLAIYGPPGLDGLFDAFKPFLGRLHFPLHLEVLKDDETVGHDEFEIQAFGVDHRGANANGYALYEDDRPGRFDPAAAKAAGVPEGPAYAALQRGEEVKGAGGMVAPEQVMGPDRPGRTVVLTGDTSPSPATVSAAADAELLIHDATFIREDADRAAETGHSTIEQAAAIADEAHVKMLALVHISSRYHVGNVLKDAREIFEPTVAPKDFDQVAIPFPERGDPQLIQNGARENDQAQEKGNAGDRSLTQTEPGS
jgi:ribonuclease Z